MSHPFSVLLGPYGWSDRVAALYSSDPRSEEPDVRPARVSRVERGGCLVVDGRGPERPVRSSEQLAVGDWAIVDDDRALGVLPRWSSLGRLDPAGGSLQVLAADVDLVVVTVPADRINPARVERELTVAWESGARPLVALTKADLAGADAAAELGERLSVLEVVAVSARTGAGVDRLGALLAGSTSVLLGPSGAGKSSLVNALAGAELRVTGEVRAGDGRGRHTTTSRQLLALPGGVVVIDTPGLRSLGLASAERIGEVFGDVEQLAAGCRFADCAHDREPGCAVTAAVSAGELPAARLTSYRKLAREAAAEALRSDPLARREARRAWKQQTMQARRHDKRG